MPRNREITTDEARESRNRQWREQNSRALAQYTEEVEREGLALAAYRSF
ncbi:type II toxin-antitoxin system CcdA family antitoxin [Roseivivax marinus]|nr:type II toxin-antitoxin system CcdA family antitoxin [Roseivivax marinus]